MDSSTLYNRAQSFKQGVENLESIVSADEQLDFDKWSVKAQEAIQKKAEDASVAFERQMFEDNAGIMMGQTAWNQAGGAKAIYQSGKKTYRNIQTKLNEDNNYTPYSEESEYTEPSEEPEPETSEEPETPSIESTPEELGDTPLDEATDAFSRQTTNENSELAATEENSTIAAGQEVGAGVEGAEIATGVTAAESDVLPFAEMAGEAAPIVLGVAAVGGLLYGGIESILGHHPHRQALSKPPAPQLPANFERMKSFMVNASSDAAVDAQASSVAF